MKKIIRISAVIAFVFSLLLVGNAITSKAASKKVNDAYKKFVTQLKSENHSKNNIYTATIKAKQGHDILLVSYHVFDFKGYKAISAKAYQYINHKVKYIGAFHSNGTDFALASSGKYFYINTLHSSEKIAFENGKATSCKIDGTYLNYRNAVMKRYTIQNNKRTVTFSKKINSKTAEKKIKKNYDAEEIIFKKA